MIGPVLVKQDKPEATMNVEKRLEFINGEMYAQRPLVGRTRGGPIVDLELTFIQQACRGPDSRSWKEAGAEEDGDYPTSTECSASSGFGMKTSFVRGDTIL